jgi:hypothetical protein
MLLSFREVFVDDVPYGVVAMEARSLRCRDPGQFSKGAPIADYGFVEDETDKTTFQTAIVGRTTQAGSVLEDDRPSPPSYFLGGAYRSRTTGRPV